MLNSFKLIVLLISVLTLFSNSLQAKLIIVADKGGEPTQSYYEELGLTSLIIDAPADSQNTPIIKPVTLAQMLPVMSAKLTPGQMVTRKIQAVGVTPFFMIGNDLFSKQWLIKRKQELFKIGAKGLVVNVRTYEELAALQALAPELLLQPTYADDIAERLNLIHYPVLITSSQITQ